MKSKSPRQEVWERERQYASEPRFWKSFAIEARACAEFLLSKYWESLTSGELNPAFFGFKFVRMLMAYSLENLAKGLLLARDEQHKYLKENKISWGKHGHDLPWLFKELELAASSDELFFLEAWSISAEWYGKYPFPSEMNRVLDEYVPMPTSEALLRRSMRGKREHTQKDLLHGSIGDIELDSYQRLFNSLMELYAEEADEGTESGA